MKLPQYIITRTHNTGQFVVAQKMFSNINFYQEQQKVNTSIYMDGYGYGWDPEKKSLLSAMPSRGEAPYQFCHPFFVNCIFAQ